MKINLKQIPLNIILCFALMAFIWIFGFYILRDQANLKTELTEYWENKDFKTDSTILAIDYSKIPKPEYKYQVPPQSVTIYVDSSKVYHTYTTIESDSNTIQLLDSLQQVIAIYKKKFLVEYPESPKLIYGKFQSDTMAFDFLFPDGSLQTLSYGVNYNRFNYQFRNGKLEADNKKQVRNKNNLSLYAYGGYNITQKTINTGVLGTYGIYNKWGILGNSYITLEQTPQFNAFIGVSYKLK